MAGFPPLTTQGLLNRVLTHIVVPGFPQLSVSAQYMSKSMAVPTFDGPFVDQIPTATGVVNSPAPYVMGQIVVNLLRSQALCTLWIAQAQIESTLGDVVAYSDSTVFPPITLNNTSIIDIDPGAFDGSDPTTKITLKGVFLTNADLWAGELAAIARTQA